MHLASILVLGVIPAAQAGPPCTLRDGKGLCDCAELVKRQIIKSEQECTQRAVIDSCRTGACNTLQAMPRVPPRQCTMTYGLGLCDCSQLMQKDIVNSTNGCTTQTTIDACKSGACNTFRSDFNLPSMNVWQASSKGTDCSVGGQGLCGCSELIEKHIIKSMNDCTQGAAVAACLSGSCSHPSQEAITV